METVGELKKALEGLADDVKCVVYSCPQCHDFQSIKDVRVRSRGTKPLVINICTINICTCGD